MNTMGKIRKQAIKNEVDVNQKFRGSNQERSQRQILSTGIIIITIGVIIILLNIILSVFLVQAVDETKILLLKWLTVMENLLMCLGTTLVTIGAGTVLYSYFDFVNYVQDKLKDVVVNRNFTDIMSDEAKKELAYRLEKEILHHTEVNNLYDFVQDEVLSLARKAFYEEFTLNISCERKGNEIHKTIYKDYVINCKTQPDFDICKNNNFAIKCKETCPTNPAEYIELSINGINFSGDDYELTEENTNDEVYNKRCIYTLNEQAKEKIKNGLGNNWDYKYNVSSEMESIVLDDDMTFSFRLYFPCKKTTFLFTYNPEEFEVMEDVFAFKDTDTDDAGKKKSVVTRHNKGSILVNIDNWILPGDGITFVLSPIRKK